MAKRPGLLFNLGAFVGGVSKGIRTPVGGSREVGRRVAEQSVLTPHGPIVLRRTVIDEVVAPAKNPAGTGRGGSGRRAKAGDPTERRPG